MTFRERVLTWSTLIALAGLVTSTLLRPSAPAVAEETTRAPELGPASALTLEATDGTTRELRLEDGRLAWGPEPQQTTQAIAYVHIGALLPTLMQQAEWVEEREALGERLTDEAQVMIDELEGIKSELEGLDEEDRGPVMQRGQALAQQLQAFQQQAAALQERMTAEQLEKCYRELVDAVNLVADRKKIDTVLRFIPTDDPFTPGDSNAAMLQIRLRALLRYPEGFDITGDVADELNIDLE